jgi:hypothetical protein
MTRKDKLIDRKQRMSEGFTPFSVMCPQPDTVQFWPCRTSALVGCCTLLGHRQCCTLLGQVNRGQEKTRQDKNGPVRDQEFGDRNGEENASKG